MDVRANAVRDGIWRLAARLAQPDLLSADLDEAAATLCFVAGARAVAFYALTGPVDGHPYGFRVLGAHGHPGAPRERGPTSEALAPAALFGDVRAALRDRRAVSTPRIAAEGTPSDLVALHRQGFFSALAAPVLSGDQPLGAIHALFDSGRDDERALAVVQCASLLASALLRGGRGDGAVLQTWPLGPGKAPPPSAPAGSAPTLPAASAPAEALDAALNRAHALGTRHALSYAVVACQVANAGRLRDHYGKKWLRDVVDRLGTEARTETRVNDHMASTDDGVLLVLVGTNAEGALARVRRLFERFGQLSFVAGEGRLQVGLRAGLSAWPDDGAVTGAGSRRAADTALASTADEPWVVAISAGGAGRPA